VITTTFFSANTPVFAADSLAVVTTGTGTIITHLLPGILAYTAAVIFIYLAGFLALRLFIFRTYINTESVLLQIIPPQFSAKDAYATNQLITLLHSFASNPSAVNRLIGNHKQLSLEIVSTKRDGLRYIVRVPKADADSFKQLLVSYLTGVEISVINDYLMTDSLTSVIPVFLQNHFAYPLNNQTQLDSYDPIASLTGSMTQLAENDLVAMQLVISPLDHSSLPDIRRIKQLLAADGDISLCLRKNSGGQTLLSLLRHIFLAGLNLLFFPLGLLIFFVTNGKEGPFIPLPAKPAVETVRNPYQQELQMAVKQKIDQPLFVSSIRFLVQSRNPSTLASRMRDAINAISVFSTHYQSLVRQKTLLQQLMVRLNFSLFRSRSLNLFFRPILSVTEVANLYHFPYFKTTKTEDIRKVFSRQLPAPLALKNNTNLDVIFGSNSHAGSVVPIGLTDDDRSRHVYLIGQTGSGKTTIMFHMAKQDIEQGRGLAVIDPHGDLAEDLLATVPVARKDQLIYLNPYDIAYPIGINLLELTPGLSGDDLELEKELVCESVVSIFRRVFSKDENSDAHRIEYILRNTIHTAFTVKDATIFTLYDLLNDQDFREKVINSLTDENLKLFWKSEFGMAGDYQVVKMVSGVTAKVGRFLFSPTAKRILEQPKSTINFDDILASGKILICNLAEGKLGEDTSQLLGTTIIAKIQQAAVRRARINPQARNPFYLFVDEFQNFAMASFTKLLSGSRKFGLRITIAEQSTSQQSDRNIVDVILANTGTVICFRTASPVDEALMLKQFAPEVSPGEIAALPRYHFYIKLSSLEPETPFSGTTLPIEKAIHQQLVSQLIDSSRTNYAIRYSPPNGASVTNKASAIIKKINSKLGLLH
jgi:hypothetical protein